MAEDILGVRRPVVVQFKKLVPEYQVLLWDSKVGNKFIGSLVRFFLICFINKSFWRFYWFITLVLQCTVGFEQLKHWDRRFDPTRGFAVFWLRSCGL